MAPSSFWYLSVLTASSRFLELDHAWHFSFRSAGAPVWLLSFLLPYHPMRGDFYRYRFSNINDRLFRDMQIESRLIPDHEHALIVSDRQVRNDWEGTVLEGTAREAWVPTPQLNSISLPTWVRFYSIQVSEHHSYREPPNTLKLVSSSSAWGNRRGTTLSMDSSREVCLLRYAKATQHGRR
ncbi:hypothetical protein B0T19DRAFT_35342 [Cercophora scortea]|uniref:Uncharacterized protein n=1 Tax=Cercophora scortea TaxID=314031 RepID=A0AAE0J3N6_9PEZI|nr:hypothetical protein B0T19DRAFT_35342 [Cercophora scortea]